MFFIRDEIINIFLIQSFFLFDTCENCCIFQFEKYYTIKNLFILYYTIILYYHKINIIDSSIIYEKLFLFSFVVELPLKNDHFRINIRIIFIVGNFFSYKLDYQYFSIKATFSKISRKNVFGDLCITPRKIL